MTDSLDQTRAYWDRHATRDPLWAILSDTTKANRQWDVGRFFQTGVSQIATVFYQLDSRRLEIGRRAALDFGCGVGRLTQALAPRFDRVVGVDVSPRMLELAAGFNRFPSRVDYVVNRTNDLRAFDEATFDFLISHLVLQHVRPDVARNYLAEFFRVLAPGAVLVFQLPSHLRTREQSPVTSGPKPMPDDAYQAEIAVTGAAHLTLEPNAKLTLDVVVTNVSPLVWAARDYGDMRIGNHWWSGAGDRMLNRDDGRVSLPAVVTPGEACRAALTITAPAEAGQYQCEIDVAHEGVLWFHDKGSAVARIPVSVAAAGATGADPREFVSAPSNVSPLPERPFDPSLLQSLEGVDPGETDPGEFPMHGVPQAAVVDLIARHGGRLLHIEDDTSAGDEWMSFRYYVQKEVSRL